MARTPQKPDGKRASSRSAVIAVAIVGLLVLAAGAILGTVFRDNPKGAAGTALAGLIGGPFHLTDQNGKPFTDADLKGKWNLLFFGYTHCPDTCPTALNELSLAIDRLGKKRDDVRIVLISVDPERDTPAVLKSYVESFDAPIVALTGTADEVKQAAASYRVFYAKHPRSDGNYDMDHSALIYVMDPQGRFTSTFAPDDRADAISKRLEKLLS